MRQRPAGSIVPVLAAAALSFGGSYLLFAPDNGASVLQAALGGFGGMNCNIKGNVSVASGERIYHVPGQRYYIETIIRQEYGERYSVPSRRPERQAGGDLGCRHACGHCLPNGTRQQLNSEIKCGHADLISLLSSHSLRERFIVARFQRSVLFLREKH